MEMGAQEESGREVRAGEGSEGGEGEEGEKGEGAEGEEGEGEGEGGGYTRSASCFAFSCSSLYATQRLQWE